MSNTMPSILKARIYYIGVFLCLLGYARPIGESTAQVLSDNLSSEIPKASESKRQRKVFPFAGYEDRLRQSPRWQTMTLEEQTEALEKIGLARKKILEQHQQLQTQYEDQIKKMKKPRETLMSKRRKRKKNQESDVLWNHLQALPIEERLNFERQLGLDKFLPSQKQKKLEERFNSLSYSERKDIFNQIQ